MPFLCDIFRAVYVNGAKISPVEQVRKSRVVKFWRLWRNLPWLLIDYRRRIDTRIRGNSQLKILFPLVPIKSEVAQFIKTLQRDITNSISALRMRSKPVLTLSLRKLTIQDIMQIPKSKDLDLTSWFQSLDIRPSDIWISC